jgi:hypothetical protein
VPVGVSLHGVALQKKAMTNYNGKNKTVTTFVILLLNE